jgi:hypothetical protein
MTNSQQHITNQEQHNREGNSDGRPCDGTLLELAVVEDKKRGGWLAHWVCDCGDSYWTVHEHPPGPQHLESVWAAKFTQDDVNYIMNTWLAENGHSPTTPRRRL